MGENKSPLQETKAAVVEEIVADKVEEKAEIKAGVKPGTKRGTYSKSKKTVRKPRKPIIPEVIYTEDQALNDANFLTAMIDEMRKGNGLPEIKESHKKFLNPSAKTMFMKYGSSTSRWMPEIMFAGTLLFIGIDTVREAKALKAKTEKEKPVNQEQRKKKPDLKDMEKLSGKDKIKPTKTL